MGRKFCWSGAWGSEETAKQLCAYPGESDGAEEVWARKVLLMFRCLVKGEREGGELAFVL